MKTQEEKQEEKKRRKKEYYEQNKEKILQKSKDYYQKNKEKAIAYQKEYQKEYREKNQAKIKAYRELYKKRATNKQVVNALNLKLEELHKKVQLEDDQVFNYLCRCIELTRGLFDSELDKELLSEYIEDLIASALELRS